MQGFSRTDQLGRGTRIVLTDDALELNSEGAFIHTPTGESRRRDRESTWPLEEFRA